MAERRETELKAGTEEFYVKQFVDNKLRQHVEKWGYQISTQINLPYTNFCDRINENGEGVNDSNGQNLYATDIIVYKQSEDGSRIPLVVIEGKIKSYTTHDVITYSEKARSHKTVFPHLQYGFIVLLSDSKEFRKYYYRQERFDFAEIFPKETPEDQTRRIGHFAEELKRQIELAEKKYQVFFS